MISKDRMGNILSENEGQDRFLENLYTTKVGRTLVKVLISPSISKIGGWALNRRISKIAINSFVEKNNIDLTQYEETEFNSYNDFFMRRIKKETRPINFEGGSFISPCDSKLTIHQINEDSKFVIKNTEYTMESLTRSKKIADKFRGGTLLLFRLTVDDYHRYCYIDSGYKTRNYWIKGVFHTVNPIANDQYPIYKENTRCLSFLNSDNFGTLMMMEVGALMVGKIVNYHDEMEVRRGQEKGRFEFGGSTIIICTKPGKVKIDEDIIANSKEGIETKVKYGEKIGTKN